MEKAKEKAKEKVYLYGDGNNLKRSWEFLTNNYCICGIIDHKHTRSSYDMREIPLYEPGQLSDLDKNIKVIITCVYVPEINRLLVEAGFKYIENIFKLREDEHFCFHKYNVFDEHYYEDARALLGDDESRYVFDQILYFRKCGVYDYSEICSKEVQYFPESIYILDEAEIMVDAGAFIGDTIETFKKITQNKFKKIYAFEPNQENYNALLRQTNDDNRIECYPYAVWDCEEKLGFAEDSYSGYIDTNGVDSVVQAISIDSVIKTPVSLIKMDVEGSELRALQGAKQIIKKYHPRLSISVYHKEKDLYQIPLYLHKEYPEYKFSLRHHGQKWLETVLYAY
ncbi:MAG: FkbM family methyltransferase [Selenomonadaceae bacterium]|nr:FkbM family methyltransferase [Selenomonadaceae bacterium]